MRTPFLLARGRVCGGPDGVLAWHQLNRTFLTRPLSRASSSDQ